MNRWHLGLLAAGIWTGAFSCAPTGIGDPQTPRGARFRADAGEDITAGAGDTVALSARGVNGMPPFIYRWSVERTPDGAEAVAIADERAQETAAGPLDTQGRYVFRVVVVDGARRDADAFVTVTVGPPGTGSTTELSVSIEGPDVIEPLASGHLRALADAEGEFTYLWEVVTAPPVMFDTPDQSETDFTVDEPGTVVLRVTVTDAATGAVGAAELTVSVQFEGALRVAAAGPTSVEVSDTIEVTATAENANGTLTFNWTVLDGEAELTAADTPTVSVRPTAVGRLAVQVEVTDDADGEVATDQYVVTVDPDTTPLTLRATGPDILRVNETATVSVEIEQAAEFDEISYAWEVVSGDATFDDAAVATPKLTVLNTNGETIGLRVVVTATNPTESRVGETDVFVVTIADDRPEVGFTVTGFGDIVFELRADITPKTAANLLRYVDDGFYDDTAIHRVAADFVIQGGGYELDENGELVALETRDPVPSEADTGMSNTNGTVAMALSGGDADSGTSQWFINLIDNSGSLDPQNFTAFATVVEGQNVVDAIAAVDTGENPFAPPGEQSLPVDQIIIESARRR